MNRRKICADCVDWKPGEFWGDGSGKHGVVIECKGWCVHKPNKRKRWNYCPACKDFNKRKMKGFFYQGGDGKTLEEDIQNITELMKELMEDNKSEN